MQNKYIKYIAGLSSTLILAVLGLSMLLNSCKKDETNNTVALYSYGPMPVARGAELKFIGKNLDQVTSIVLPGGESITTFGTKTSDLLTITVPQDATSGLVTLKSTQGDIVTKTVIGYYEPISIDALPSTSIKAGDVLTITGDYLNLVQNVIFANNVIDSVFVSKSRKEIKIIVPEKAQTGKIALSDGKRNPSIVYSSTALNVTLPAFTSVAPIQVKADSALTITGTNLDLVKSVVLGAGKKVVTIFKSQTASQIVLSVPNDTQDGNITMIPVSGVNVVFKTPLEMVIPTVSVTPTTVKNGSYITVTGTDLDLVDKVLFADNIQGSIKAGGTTTQIEVTVPDKAVSGVVKFVTKALKTVSGSSLTIVDPTITSSSPSAVSLKSNVTISGTDLDLITDVTFVGDVKGTIQSQSSNALVVSVPYGSKKGKITLTSKNGKQFQTADEVTILYDLPNFDSYTETVGSPGGILTLNGTNMHVIKELTFDGDIIVTDYLSKSDTKIEIYIPKSVQSGLIKVSMLTYENEVRDLPKIQISRGVDPVVNPVLCFFDFNGTGKDSWWGNSIGSGIVTDPTNSADGTPFWNVNGMSTDGWWDGLFWRNGGNNFSTTGVDMATYAVRFDINVREIISAGSGVLKIRIGDYYYTFKPWETVPGGYKTVGWATVTCPLTGFYNGATQMTSIPTSGDFGMVWSSGTSVKVNMGIDNVRFEKIP